MIAPDILKQFKERMKLGNDEDENLTFILTASLRDLMHICGDYDINSEEEFRELVFERSRYVYNDALEFFHQNFLTQINNLSIRKALEDISVEGDADAKV
jgi:hypothetical protein